MFKWEQVFPNYYDRLQIAIILYIFKSFDGMERLSKTEAEEKIKETFSKKLSPREIKKIKRLAMKHNIKLKDLRKKFCKKCYSTELRVKSIKNKVKTVECKNCKNIMRWKIKTS